MDSRSTGRCFINVAVGCVLTTLASCGAAADPAGAALPRASASSAEVALPAATTTTTTVRAPASTTSTVAKQDEVVVRELLDFPFVKFSEAARSESERFWVESSADGNVCVGETGDNSESSSCTADPDRGLSLQISNGQAYQPGGDEPDTLRLYAFASSMFVSLRILDGDTVVCDIPAVKFAKHADVVAFGCDIPLVADPTPLDVEFLTGVGERWRLAEGVTPLSLDAITARPEALPDLPTD